MKAPEGEFKAYQRQALGTAVYPGQGNFLGLMYCALKLAGEAGEVAEKVGKLFRDANCQVSPESRDALGKELGDVLWYIAGIATELDIDLGDVAKRNLEKLAGRKARGTLHGSGDDR